MHCELTLSNYRCFGDSPPTKITIKDGFTALVGPNNAGKSTLLKWFLESRSFFTQLPTNYNLRDACKMDSRLFTSFNHVQDPTEAYSEFNNRDLVFSIKLLEDLAEPDVSELQWAISHQQQIKIAVARKDISLARYADFTHHADLTYRGSNAFFNFVKVFNVLDCFARMLYIPPFRNALNEGASSQYDFEIGTGFIATWDRYKTGPERKKNRLAERVTTDIARIFGASSLQINASDDKKTLHLIVDGKQGKLREFGSGLAQFIIVFVNAAIKNPSFILIDEPELNLHPSLQVDFLQSLAAYSENGIIFATHSMGLARSVADSIYMVSRPSGHRAPAICKPLSARDPNYAQFLGEMSFASYQELGVDRILLVEGVTEVKVFQRLLRFVNLDHRVLVLPLGGTQLICAGRDLELGEIKRISPRVSVIIDSEKNAEASALSTGRLAFQKSCTDLGFHVHVTERRATENYFTNRALKIVNPAYNELGRFDKLDELHQRNRWNKSDNWRIAQELEWSEIEQTDIGVFLKELKQHITPP